MSSCIDILQEYAVGDDWKDYSDRLKQYFVANKMDTDEDAERRRAVLLTVCSAPTYSLIKDLLAPAKPSDKSYEELVNLVKDIITLNRVRSSRDQYIVMVLRN